MKQNVKTMETRTVNLTDFDLDESGLYFFNVSEYYLLKGLEYNIERSAPHGLNTTQYGEVIDYDFDETIEIEHKGLFIYNDDLDEWTPSNRLPEFIQRIEEYLLDNYND